MSLVESLKKIVFDPPKNMLALLKNRKQILEKLEKEYHSTDWYFSPDGKEAYEKLTSLAQKTNFFRDYLMSVAKIPIHAEYIYRIAFVMANSMVDSKLSFGGYPNVLNEDKNPLVRYIKNNVFELNDDLGEIYCGTLLCVLHTGSSAGEDTYMCKGQPYEKITYCEGDEPLTDMYKIERDIISAFSLGSCFCYDEKSKKDSVKKKTTFVPYFYSIFSSLDETEDDENVDDKE